MVQLKYFAAPLALLSGVFAEVHQVAVGGGGNVFTPDTLKASVGDFVEFHFSGRHSVAQSAFNSPCKSSGSTDIYSGIMSSGVFTIKVNTTDPIWYFCSYSSHCQGGMAGVINPNSDSLDSYKTAAGSTSGSSTPSGVQNGYVGTADLTSGSSSSSSSAAASGSATSAGSTATTATTATSTASSTANAAAPVKAWGLAGLAGVLAAIAA